MTQFVVNNYSAVKAYNNLYIPVQRIHVGMCIKSTGRYAAVDIREFVVAFLLTQHSRIRNGGVIQIAVLQQSLYSDLQPGWSLR